MKPLKKANKGSFRTYICAVIGLLGLYMFSVLTFNETNAPIIALIYVVIFGSLLLIIIVAVPSRSMWKRLKDMKETDGREQS